MTTTKLHYLTNQMSRANIFTIAIFVALWLFIVSVVLGGTDKPRADNGATNTNYGYGYGYDG